MSGRKKKKHQGRRREKRADSFIINFDIPGVVKIVLSALTQKAVSCTVGEQVTAEKSWVTIQKDAIDYHLDVHGENSEFAPYRQEILDFVKEEFLIGYIPDESRDYDEFYLCLTPEAEESVSVITKKIADRQQARLNNSIQKKIGQWISMGSDADVDETMYKNNRALMEVEIEAKYPIISSKITFRIKTVQDIEDGYAEFRADKSAFTNVLRKRIDTGVQVAPAAIDNVAQTTCRYPKNTWTQYWYEFETIKKLSPEFSKSFTQFVKGFMNDIHDTIIVNSHINLFTNDYSDLVVNPETTNAAAAITAKEYLSFTDIKYCKGKMISSISWHPMWTGIIAISYMTNAPNAYSSSKQDIDEVNYIIHNTHVVLIWSFVDGLQAKLYLDSPREVNCVSFCPFNENILVGGLCNGQIGIWDITNKLKKVEEEEILTYAQQKYRVLMFSYMDWFQNTKDLSLIRCTAISNTTYSHYGPVTSISWIDPNCRMTTTGQIVHVPENEDISLQFCTTSVDGSILYWDLLAKITLQPGDYRPQKRSRRLRKRPSALTIDVSPLRILNRLFKPIYMISMYIPKENLYLYVSCHSQDKPRVTYVTVNPDDAKKKLAMADRIMYRPHYVRQQVEWKKEFYGGTVDGYFYSAGWEGFEVNSGEVINKEICKVFNVGRYHDGPVVNISRNKGVRDILLTVGGKVFAIWKESLRDRPILWRRSKYRYTYGSWNLARRSLFRLCRSDGNRETWDMLSRSDAMMYEQNLSGKILTGSYIHSLRMKHNVNAIADYNGTLRLIYTPAQLSIVNKEAEDEEIKRFDDQCKREVIRKTEFLEWQERWMNKHASWIKAQREEAVIQQKLKEENAANERQKQEDERIRLEREAARLRAAKLHPPPGHYLEWAKEMYLEKEQRRMGLVLLAKKQLNPELLKKQQQPLKAIEKEQKHKKLKQKERLKQSDKLFNDTVAMLFPNVLIAKERQTADPYAGGDPISEHERCLAYFAQLSDISKEYVDENVYTYVLNWKDVLATGRDRRRLLEINTGVPSHRNRMSTENKESEEPYVEHEEPTGENEDDENEYAGDTEDN